MCDLVDLQLIASNGTVDLCATRAVCERLFAYRRKQDWPPAVVKQPGWDELYAEQASGLPVEQEIDRAIEWANALIGEIERAPKSHASSR